MIDVVGNLLQDLVKVAGRRQQACLHQAIEDVFLCLGDPLPLGLQRAEVLVVVTLVLNVVDLDRLVVRLVGGQLQAVAPDISLGLERYRVLRALLRLFYIDADRQPEARLEIFAPAVEVEVAGAVVVLVATGVGAVEADDVPALVFNPDTAGKAAAAGSRLGVHVEYQRAHCAQEVAADIAEVIMLLVERDRIQEHHLHKAGGDVLHLERLGQTRTHTSSNP